MSRLGTVKINQVEYDLDDLTLDEMERFEEIAGTSFSTADFGSARVLRAIATVLLQRTNPTITAEEIGRVRLVDMMPGDEEMPDLGPSEADEENQSESAPADSGAPLSAVSIPG